VATYVDIHDILGVKAGDVIGAHEADVRVQARYGVNYKHYWVDEEACRVLCLVEGPDRESATRVHQEAHGLVAPRRTRPSRAPSPSVPARPGFSIPSGSRCQARRPWPTNFGQIAADSAPARSPISHFE
jgi:hypothetical protein